MTQETAWLDYDNEPPGYDVWVSMGNSGWQTGGVRVADNIADAWSHYKREHDPPGMQVFVWPKEKASDPPTAWCVALRGKVHFAAFTEPEPDACRPDAETEARAHAWAWHDRRRAIVLDIDEQTCSGGKHLGAWMSIAIAWTDAECAEVEAYAALPFPRSVDMPAPLQRVLLPEGERTC